MRWVAISLEQLWRHLLDEILEDGEEVVLELGVCLFRSPQLLGHLLGQSGRVEK